MSPLPNVNVRIEDGALGLLPPNSSQTHVKVGVSSLGTPHTLYGFSNPSDLVAMLGTGPLVEAAAYSLSVAGGPLYVLPIAASIPGVVGPVKAMRANDSTASGVLTISGSPLDGYDVRVSIVQGGTLGSSPGPTFQVRLDGGLSPVLAMPSSGTYRIQGTGLALHFASGGWTAGDSFAFVCDPPTYTLPDLAAALHGLLGDPRTWGFVHIVGAPGGEDDDAKGAGTASLVATVGTFMRQSETRYRYARAVIEAPQVADAALIRALSPHADERVLIAAGYASIVSPLTGRQATRSAAWPITARAAAVAVSEDLGRVATGPLKGIVSLDRDEEKSPGLDAERFTTLRTIVGRPGAYVTNPNLFASPGSDFLLWQNGRVMDVACSVTRNALLQYLNDEVRVDGETGCIFEKDAQSIERHVEGQLRAALVQPGDASDVTIKVNRTDNILSTRTLRVSTRVLPLAYAKFIELTIGFTNPALAIV